MKYFYEPPKIWEPMYGQVYICNHPLFKKATLYEIKEKGLCVIQQRFDPDTKKFWWGSIDPWLANDIYLAKGFLNYFREKAGTCKDGLYPTVTVRQIMWALRMKPLRKEYWEEDPCSQKMQLP